MRVLVVEDSRLSRKNLVLMMEISGHEVDAVETAEDAIALIVANDYDAVISDLRLPGRANGIDVLERQRNKNSACRLVLATAFCSIFACEEAGRVGALYMEKPLMLSRIIDYIEGRSPGMEVAS